MRIIDKNTDFYDYQAEIYQDNTNIFDRTDSFLLTKQLMCQGLKTTDHWDTSVNRWVLLQVCNDFWLFYVKLTKFEEYPYAPGLKTPIDYDVTLVAEWTNYSKPRCLIKLHSIRLDYKILHLFSDYNLRQHHSDIDLTKVEKHKDVIIQSIDTNNFAANFNLGHCEVRTNTGESVTRHIPLLKASGLASFIDPLTIYIAFDEYFSAEKQAAERTESVGITDQEKIENHGFDTKSSFRGKIKKGTKNGQDSDSQKP